MFQTTNQLKFLRYLAIYGVTANLTSSTISNSLLISTNPFWSPPASPHTFLRKGAFDLLDGGLCDEGPGVTPIPGVICMYIYIHYVLSVIKYYI
jgi:hypothetical protein